MSVKTLKVWDTCGRLSAEETTGLSEGRGREARQEPRGREGDARPRLRPHSTDSSETIRNELKLILCFIFNDSSLKNESTDRKT